MKKFKYVRLDADNVGDKIELMLLNGKVKEAKHIHQSVQLTVAALVAKFNSNDGYKVLMVGCDDILLRVNSKVINIQFLQEMNIDFTKNTGFSLSIGIGNNINEAMLNLRRAKLLGKNRIEMCK